MGLDSGASYGSQFVDAVGDGTGSMEMNVDGSGTSKDFKVTVPEGKIYFVERMLLSVRDTGSLDADKYGNGIVMPNGIDIIIDKSGTETKLTAQRPIRTSGCLAAYCFDVDPLEFGTGDEILVARWTFTKDGTYITLHEGDSFIMRINDNLLGLNSHTVRLGFKWVYRKFG